MEISVKEQGALARAVAKCADALEAAGMLAPGDPDIAYARNFGERERLGQIGPEYFGEVFSLRKQGCTCKVRIERTTPGGGFEVTHEPTCGLLTWREQQRAERQERAERYQQLRRGGGAFQPVTREG